MNKWFIGTIMVLQIVASVMADRHPYIGGSRVMYRDLSFFCFGILTVWVVPEIWKGLKKNAKESVGRADSFAPDTQPPRGKQK